MSLYRGPYYSATSCKSAARSGTDALVSWYLGAYDARGAANLGTYACKRLGSGWSIHAERRAADLGTAPYGGVDSDWGWTFANALRLNSAELGIQLIILSRRVWSCRFPDSGWRAYTGEYHGHAHVELTPAASLSLTRTKIQSTIGGSNVNQADADLLINRMIVRGMLTTEDAVTQLLGRGLGSSGVPTVGVALQTGAFRNTGDLITSVAQLRTLVTGLTAVDEEALAAALAPAVAALVTPALVAAIEANGGVPLNQAQVTEAVKAAMREGTS